MPWREKELDAAMEASKSWTQNELDAIVDEVIAEALLGASVKLEMEFERDRKFLASVGIVWDESLYAGG